MSGPLITYQDSGRREDIKGVRRMKKRKGVIPKSAKGKMMVAKLGRTKKTGGFAKISAKATAKYGSKERGDKVTGSIFWKMVKARRGKKRKK